ncbi:division/cell wall cluster transcriptional repressor MraZ [Sphingomonas hengshuiensis]|uniref:Division/cell wall cluster transcriptional repressor MraZ n=1 Tax=Sphingomonas hengshuiensis TaxID=1609977 RepID=A0A7U4J712_9SPHN|nr:division/cell wall cluster transcriptional repressor MraZ [Sphingomonas hengshuiensis]AJP71425.1 hypothetical protein TS85_06015 [Sphingomonas hengshuiensis]
MSSLFHGSALCEVDADGNVPMPGFVNEALDADRPELLVGKHESDACLVGYDRAHLDTVAARNERRRLADEARGEDARGHYRRMRRSFGLVGRMPRADATLRIPAEMRHLGRIGGLALFLGAGDRFEIWNPDLAMQSDDDQVRALAAFTLDAGPSKGVH